MSGRLRTLKNRIRSVTSTMKITRAMELVAAAKLRRFQDRMLRGRAYAEGLEKLLTRLRSSETTFRHPFLEGHDEKRVGLLLITSDTGLCGSYNLDLIETARRFLEEQAEKPWICGVGKMGVKALKRFGYEAEQTLTDIRASQVENVLQDLKERLEKLYLSGEVGSIYAVYSHCLSITQYEDVTQKLLPLEARSGFISQNLGTGPLRDLSLDESQTEVRRHGGLRMTAEDVPYIFEPDEETILQRLIPIFFEARVRQIFLESFVSEQIARMRAMHQATENASEMIDRLVLERNKMRQAAITKEIIEVVSGSRALKK